MPPARVALLVAAAALASAQVALPYRPAGVYLIGGPSSTVQIEAFVDPFCGDAKQEYFMWQDVKDAALAKAKLTEKDVGVVFKLIVEPFHPWSWTASVGAYTAAKYGGAACPRTARRVPDPLRYLRLHRLVHLHQVVRWRRAAALAHRDGGRAARRLRVPVRRGDAQLQQPNVRQ